MGVDNTLLLTRILKFIHWLDHFGEMSQDHQNFYAGKIGRWAKALYYRRPMVGIPAVLPMVFFEIFFPQARKYFYSPIRLPIADAHYAMGFALLFRITGEEKYYQRAVQFLEVLIKTRSPAFEHYGWGYPFHWQTRGGLIEAGTPLITTTPYCYEAFSYVYQLDKKPKWLEIMRSIADHVLEDYKDFEIGPDIQTCTYTPYNGEGVINASAYRAFLLTSAWRDFQKEEYLMKARKNLNFVLHSQREDGSWPYALDGERDFIDHFHTCFVLKALTKIEIMTGDEGCSKAIEHGISYYLSHLFDHEGLPKPFSKAPRLIVYRRELYDCAECINLGILLKGRFLALDKACERTIQHILENWSNRDGSFKSRKLLIGWDNVPMHRWGQSQIFRSLCLYLYQKKFREIII